MLSHKNPLPVAHEVHLSRKIVLVITKHFSRLYWPQKQFFSPCVSATQNDGLLPYQRPIHQAVSWLRLVISLSSRTRLSIPGKFLWYLLWTLCDS